MEGRRHYGQLIGRPRLSRAFYVTAVLALACGALACGPLGAAIVMVGALARLKLHGHKSRLGNGYRVDALVTPSALYLARVGSSIDHTRTIARRSLRAGYVLPAGGDAFVVLRGRFGVAARIRFNHVDAARAFLDDLALSPVGRPMTFAFFFNLRVTVGADGVVIAVPLLRRRRFVAHESIVDIEQTSDRVVLALASGTRYEIHTGGGQQHTALVERLVEATRVNLSAEHAEPIALLRQGGRTPGAWVRELREHGSVAGGAYRAMALPEETLWRVALDPSERPNHRIGAGLALRAKLDDAGRARLRVAAGAAASPRVRIALEAVANENEDELVAAALQRRL